MSRFAWETAAPGLANAFRSLAGGSYQNAYDKEANQQSLIAQRAASIRGTESNIALDGARQQEVEAKVALLKSRPDIMQRLMANFAEMGVPQFTEAQGRVEQGLPAQVEDNGVQNVIVPGADNKVRAALRQGLPILSDPSANVDQISRASGQYAEQDRLGQLRDPNTPISDILREHQVQLAGRGGSRFGVDEGMSVDQFTGVGSTPTPVGGSQITRNIAAAGASNASASRTKKNEKSDRMTLRETVDEDGNPIIERVAVDGPAGRVDTVGKPRDKREADDLEVEREYIDTYGRDPVMREKGAPTQVEFKNAAKRFKKDPQMKDSERGKFIAGRGFEVFKDGKLVGHWK